MAPKKVIPKHTEKKKRMMCIELKKEIIEKHEEGMRVVDLAKQYERSTSTICTILKQKETLKAITPAKGIKILAKQRTSIHQNMEKILMEWWTEKQFAGYNITEAIVCNKARSIYFDLLQTSEPSTSTSKPFKASRGWFDNFKKRNEIHSVVCSNEETNEETKAAEEYLKTFAGIIEGYIPQQVFNCGETGLFWKKLPKKTYITDEDNMKDRLNIALCANTTGECKIKPLLVYHSEIPNILKEQQVMWRTNPSAWITRQFVVEWVNLVFAPEVKKYLQENSLPLQALLVLDDAYEPNFEEDILEEFQFIKVLYLPPDITPMVQPMNQEVFSHFKKHFIKHLLQRCFEVMEYTNLTLRDFWEDHYNIVICLRVIDMAWQGVGKRTLNSGWKNLWPEVVVEGLEPEVAVVQEIVSLAKCMGLDLDEEDINEVIEERPEELEDLPMQQQIEEEEVVSTSEIKEMLGMWEKLSDFIQKKHPEKIETGRVAALFNDTCLTHFRNILEGRKNTHAEESEGNLIKKEIISECDSE